MTFTVNPWWVVAVLSLALFGVVFVWRVARDAARDARARWQGWRARRRRGQPRGISDDCWFGTHEDCDGCDCVCGHPPFALEELPPERSAGELGFTEAGGAGSSPAWVPGRRPVFPGVSVDSTPACRVRPCPDPATHPHEPGILYTHDQRPTFLERLEARRERLASAAELEHRAAYEAMGLEYPSGLMARVREAAP